MTQLFDEITEVSKYLTLAQSSQMSITSTKITDMSRKNGDKEEKQYDVRVANQLIFTTSDKELAEEVLSIVQGPVVASLEKLSSYALDKAKTALNGIK